MTKTMKKKELAQLLFGKHIELFRCPLCHEGFLPDTSTGIRCQEGHHFDLARNGYLNLVTNKQNSDYDRELFQARREIFEAGVYDPLVTKLSTLISDLDFGDLTILDAGCGEGSLLFRLEKVLTQATCVGIDISKEGIRLAGAHSALIMWCVADLARLPLQDNSVDVIVNMLSPANYEEFRRILQPQGHLIKVVPGPYYLQELRERLDDVGDYSNEAVMANLEENLEITSRKRLHYQVSLPIELWSQVVKMTPLTEHRVISGNPAQQLTIDLEIVCGVLAK